MAMSLPCSHHPMVCYGYVKLFSVLPVTSVLRLNVDMMMIQVTSMTVGL